ncbi:MAG TPA: hypothetical protein VGH65_09745 [Verrucomicrobiaceae bacterium]
MSFIHENLSVVELLAVLVAAAIVLTLIIAVLTNLKGLARYIRIKSM